ncbi:Do family serine endopeptidase [Aquisediminimonas profunda]|uniref:Do family serine endopeptidase n=1 Tax=Aquisediminimonas profunda TaxID=1550733 RepID=UPI001C635668|nr:Do family serine endopeptidase [Aquisediminimonas profunda]
MRYAYAITSALLLGGTAATLALQTPGGAQTAQNEPGSMMAANAPRAGAPMSFADLAARLQPAVVNISTTQRVQVNSNPFAGTPFGDLFGGGDANGGRPVTREAQSLGSGFIISPDGYIVTNNHVISGGEGPGAAAVASIKVIMPDRTEYDAKLIGRDPTSDLAVLKINATNLPFVRFGDSTKTRVGDWVVAIGNPFGLGGTVTAGIVSALHRVTGQGGAYDRYIQTDASINQGNSGGPMFDINGNVIGINTMIFSPTGGNIGIGFAIPAEQAFPIVEKLKGGGKIARGYLGVGIQPLDEGIADSLGIEKNHGELIARVEPGQAADKAGIKQGDVVVKVNGREVTPDQTLSYLVANQAVGSRVPIEVIRDGRRQTVTAVIGERPSEEKLASLGAGGDPGLDPEDEKSSQTATRASLGLALQTLTPDISRQLGLNTNVKGVVIGAVDPSSDAATKGLQRGDVIISVNYKPANTPADVAAAANAAKLAGRSNVLLFVQRGQNPARYLAIKLKQG